MGKVLRKQRRRLWRRVHVRTREPKGGRESTVLLVPGARESFRFRLSRVAFKLSPHLPPPPTATPHRCTTATELFEPFTAVTAKLSLNGRHRSPRYETRTPRTVRSEEFGRGKVKGQSSYSFHQKNSIVRAGSTSRQLRYISRNVRHSSRFSFRSSIGSCAMVYRTREKLRFRGLETTKWSTGKVSDH